MARVIYFSGAHRSGKTTLAEIVAAGLPHGQFVKTHTKELIALHGYNMFALDIEEAMDKQKMLFDYHLEVFGNALASTKRETKVFDRSLIDYMAHTYMLFDIGVAQNMTVEQRNRATNLLNNMQLGCNELRKYEKKQRHFLVEPLSMFVEEEGKPTEFKPSQMALHFMMGGLFHRVTGHSIVGDYEAVVQSASLNERALFVWGQLEYGIFSFKNGKPSL